jgi:hypothetical protein
MARLLAPVATVGQVLERKNTLTEKTLRRPVAVVCGFGQTARRTALNRDIAMRPPPSLPGVVSSAMRPEEPRVSGLIGKVGIIGTGRMNAMTMPTGSAAANSGRRLDEARFDFPLRGFKNFKVTRADSARDDNCRFPKERKCCHAKANRRFVRVRVSLRDRRNVPEQGANLF